MRQNSFEHEGFLYATFDFTAPQTPCGVSCVVPKNYDVTRTTDDYILQWCKPPKGWTLVPADFDDSVKEKVIAPFDWGTHLLVVDGGKAYLTQAAKARGKPGTLEKLWDLVTGPMGTRLERQRASHSYWHGKLFMRTRIN